MEMHLLVALFRACGGLGESLDMRKAEETVSRSNNGETGHYRVLTQDIVCTVAGVLWAKQVHRLDIGK